jgi:CYTH domain-containing protein
VFLWGGHYFELDTFVSPVEGFLVLEVELDDLATPVTLPPFLHIGPEVTGDDRYSNRRIALAGGVPDFVASERGF